eukprot:11452618-Alexandrium_andersonii.AAC.1
MQQLLPGCFGTVPLRGGTLVLCHGRPQRDRAGRPRVGLPWHLRGPGLRRGCRILDSGLLMPLFSDLGFQMLPFSHSGLQMSLFASLAGSATSTP